MSCIVIIMCAPQGLLSFVLHLDKHLSAIIARHGQATYGILFAIVFAETGLVLTPFLPGASWLPLGAKSGSAGHHSLRGDRPGPHALLAGASLRPGGAHIRLTTRKSGVLVRGIDVGMRCIQY